MKINIILLLSLTVLGLSACDSGFQKLEAGEYGVKFVKLPPMLGGGVQDKVISPGLANFIFPWEELYRIDTTIQTISWGSKGRGSNSLIEDSVQTRTIDGNEVLLGITVQYRLNPEMVTHIIQYVAGEKGKIESRIHDLVAAVARSDIRTHMNTLSTREFFSQADRQSAIDTVRESMNARLNPEGIIIESVIYNDHRFERIKPDGVDDSYQQKIDQTQATNQETEQEKKRIGVVVEQKKIEYNELLAQVNRVVAEAKGKKEQATLRGDSYFKSKELEAQRIKTVGLQEIEGLKKRIDALIGPGGEAILKAEIADELSKSKPNFVLINEGSSGNNVGVQKLDTNDLLKQLGLIEALKNDTPKE